MKLRRLKLKDAPFMLEWMHDSNVVSNLRTDFKTKTLDDCETFIVEANNTHESLHLAIVDDKDEYMGTVSLKHIKELVAEFGISVRSCAMGKGYSQFGMREIIHRGLNELGLHEIYWCVDKENFRAIRFYEKSGYNRCAAPNNNSYYTSEELDSYIWYHVLS